MASIGREADVRQAEGGLADRMLGEWVRTHCTPPCVHRTPPSACHDSVLTSTGTVALQVREHLLPKPAAPTPSTPPPLVTVGTALLATVGAATWLGLGLAEP